jgi:hypothetical protein
LDVRTAEQKRIAALERIASNVKNKNPWLSAADCAAIAKRIKKTR